MIEINSILCRYHEIAIKGRNRSMFERCLVENMQHLLRHDVFRFKVHRVRGRIWVDKPSGAAFSGPETDFACSALERAFGIESFSPAIHVAPDMAAIRSCVLTAAPAALAPYLAEKDVVTFRIRARRSNKDFPLRSQEIEIELATAVAEVVPAERIKLDLDNGALTIGVEVRDEFATLFFETRRGPGGLPVGSNGGVVALLSGGIDSPVACYMAMKRGCPVDYVMYHSAPYTPEDTVEKVRDIAAYLNRFQRRGRLYCCNLVPLQKQIRDLCSDKYRTVLYRRAMLRIAGRIARRNGRLALLTGDSVGQVASQTLENMSVIDRAAEMLVLRPLVGMDKNETIVMARRIGSFELSNRQVPDSCTVFAPVSAATAATPERVLEEESKIPDYHELINRIADEAETV